MTRSLAILVIMASIACGGFTLATPIAAQVVIDNYPAAAVIRGENIWLRIDPAAETEIATHLQRGDAVTLTGEAAEADGYLFYPVQVDATGETGWVRDLFINPNSIVPIETAPEAPPAAEEAEVPPEEEQERPRRRNRDQQGEQAEAPPAEEPAAEEPPPAEEPAPAPEEEPEATPAEEPEPEPAEEPAAEADDVPAASPDAVASLAGVGETASDPFTLEPGRYRVNATLEVTAAGGFSAVLTGPDGFEEPLFDETIDEPQTWTGSANVRIETAGEYVVNVTNTADAWTFEFVPR